MATISLSRRALRMGKAGVPVNDWNDLVTILNAIIDLVNELKTLYDGHKHSFDGTQAASSVSNTPVTGATTGTAAGGTASPTTKAAADSLALVK